MNKIVCIEIYILTADTSSLDAIQIIEGTKIDKETRLGKPLGASEGFK